MYGTETFTVNGEPYLVLEMISNTDENGKCRINAKIIKHVSEECFDVVINDMNKFDMNSCQFLIVMDDMMDKTYEYIVFAAGYKIPNKIVVIDVANMTYSVTHISGTLYINGFSIVVNDVKSLIVDSDVTLTDGYGNRIRLHFSSPIENFGRIFENIYARPSDRPSNIPGFRIKFYLKDGTMSRYSIKGFKHSNKELEHINKNRKEVETMPTKKNETKVATTLESNDMPTKKEEPTPREIISQYAEAYDNMTKDAIRGNEVFGLLSPGHRLSIAAHLDQIVEILEGYIK